ncbi:hypothetical protein DMUE_2502 [Dictyocoela muelleri]|nr:hypothetical protein DMUE_2502 [Dictyocoela muelleri]
MGDFILEEASNQTIFILKNHRRDENLLYTYKIDIEDSDYMVSIANLVIVDPIPFYKSTHLGFIHIFITKDYTEKIITSFNYKNESFCYKIMNNFLFFREKSLGFKVQQIIDFLQNSLFKSDISPCFFIKDNGFIVFDYDENESRVLNITEINDLSEEKLALKILISFFNYLNKKNY